MISPSDVGGWRFLAGRRRPRRAVVAATLLTVGLASVAFVLGARVGLYNSRLWIVFVPTLALLAGLGRAGLLPTVGSLWLVLLWGFTFPPLVGYLTGEWSEASRYTTPRMAGFAYGSARDELMGGLERGLVLGFIVAVVVGVTGYVAGSLVRRSARYVEARRLTG